MEPNRILFAGMYESGKTTFIAALWDYINSDKADKKLALNSLVNSENQYLEKIRAEWLQCTKVTRTYLNVKSETVHMNVLNTTNSKNLILEIPDFSGELFNSHFHLREWENDYENIVNEMGGILLFINPKDNRNRTQYIADAVLIESDIVSELNDKPIIKQAKNDIQSDLEISKENAVNSIDFSKWSEEYTSNQVKLVEALQFIASQIEILTPKRISVVISRWDLIEDIGKETPFHWLQTKMPLLHQFLICNDDIFQFQVFGVSAQGCDYSNEDERMHLLGLEPHERPQVKLEKSFINDIAEPIIWLTKN